MPTLTLINPHASKMTRPAARNPAMDDEESKETMPTPGKMQQLDEVAALIDGGEPVDPIKAMDALNDAMRYHKELPSFQVVRTFLDKYTAKIVSIILYRLDMGDIEMTHKDNVRTCLESVVELVSNDLKHACEDDTLCQTCPALARIICKVDGYTESDYYKLRNKLKESKVFDHFGPYLLNKAASRFGISEINDADRLCPISGLPSFESIMTILTMMRQHFFITNKKEKSAIARAAVLYLLSMDCKHLISLGDDAIEMCHKAKEIYTWKEYESTSSERRLYNERVSEFLDLYRKFVLKLIRAPDVTLKELGLSELSTGLIQLTKRMRPYPLYYTVSGSGSEDVNGTYDIDRTLLTSDGRLREAAVMRYVKKRDASNGGDGDMIQEFCLTHERNSYHWNIIKVTYQDYSEDNQQEKMYLSNEDVDFHFSRPTESGWWVRKGTFPCPTVTAESYNLMEGMGSTSEHELVEWIVDNDVLSFVAADLESFQGDFVIEARNSLKLILIVIDLLTTRIHQNMLWQVQLRLASESNERAQHALTDVERDKTFIAAILQYFKKDLAHKWDILGRERVSELCTTLEGMKETFESLLSLFESSAQLAI